MHSVCPCSLPVWRRSFLKKGTPVTYFGPALDRPLGRSGRKTATLVRDHEYFMHTIGGFIRVQSIGSGEEVEIFKLVYGRTTTTDWRTTDGDAMTIAHLSLRLRWAKKPTVLLHLMTVASLVYLVTGEGWPNFQKLKYCSWLFYQKR